MHCCRALTLALAKLSCFHCHGKNTFCHGKNPTLLASIAQQNIIYKITTNTLDCDQSNYSSHTVFINIRIVFAANGNSTIRSVNPKNPTQQTLSGLDK